MAFNTYAEGYRIASELANKAIQTESSLSTLAPLASPLPTLQRAFPLYISSAETYSQLISFKLTPPHEKDGIKKKWRLVLDRAEKVKAKIEELGGQVGRVDTGDEAEEADIVRRGGKINGLELSVWSEPYEREFEIGKGAVFRDKEQTELAVEQVELDPEWAEVGKDEWDRSQEEGRVVVTQGAGADCSVVAGLTVCLEHNRRWKRKLAQSSFYPRTAEREPRRSENGKHVVKLLLNGCWRSIIIDALLPRRKTTLHPLHATSHSLPHIPTQTDALRIGAPWIPLALKAFFKAHGGYSLRGSNPAPDIYAFTGWIPERCTLQDGFQREKEWKRVYNAWGRGEVLVSLGSGKDGGGEGLVPLHAYAVLDLREEAGERLVDIFDPGLPAETKCDLVRAMADTTLGEGRKTGLFTMSWDAVCQAFEAVHLNWNPVLKPVSVKKHWSWAKPTEVVGARNQPRYRLSISPSSMPLQPSGSGKTYTGAGSGIVPVHGSADTVAVNREIWLLLSQHLVAKDRPLDDIALHVYEEHAHDGGSLEVGPLSSNPYSNAQHVLVRYIPRSSTSTLLILPSRDRGIGRTDFTLQAFSSPSSTLSLERIHRPLEYTASVSGAITARSAGGHSGWPDYGINPQYKVVIGGMRSGNPNNGNTGSNGHAMGQGRMAGEVRVELQGDTGVPWNVKLLWSDGGLVHDVTSDAVIADSGPHSFGLALASTKSVNYGTYTLAISAFEPGQTGKFDLSIDCAAPIRLEAIPQEGAGMYRRTCEGEWTEETCGGRPSTGTYHLNPQIELILPRALSIQCRLSHPAPLFLSLNSQAASASASASASLASPSAIPTANPPMNLTLFSRAPGGGPGAEQRMTSGAYSDNTSGVRIGKSKVKEGVWVLVPSLYSTMGSGRHGQGQGQVQGQGGVGEGGKARRGRWRVDVWADGPFELDRVR